MGRYRYPGVRQSPKLPVYYRRLPCGCTWELWQGRYPITTPIAGCETHKEEAEKRDLRWAQKPLWEKALTYAYPVLLLGFMIVLLGKMLYPLVWDFLQSLFR